MKGNGRGQRVNGGDEWGKQGSGIGEEKEGASAWSYMNYPARSMI